MRNEIKIFLFWILALVLVRVGLEFPHREFQWIGLVDAAAQILLCILAIAIAAISRGTQRWAMINLAVFFGFVLPLLATAFVGESIFPGDPFARAYSHLYVNFVAMAFVSMVTVIYFASAYVLPRRGTLFHYSVSIPLAAGLLMLSFNPYITDPASLSAEPDYADAAWVGKVHDSLATSGIAATPESITRTLLDAKWKDRTYAEALPRTVEMLPHLDDGRLHTLYWKPIWTRMAAVNFLNLIVIVLVLTKMHGSALAYSAYSDKILIALGFIFATEAFHAYISAQAFAWANYMSLLEAGHYFTILIMAITIAILNFKLRFSALGAGQYYDRAIALNPAGTTRFVDEIDALILRAFFTTPRKPTMGTTAAHNGKGNPQ